MPRPQTDRLPSKYEIAKPQAYDAFSLTPAKAPPAGPDPAKTPTFESTGKQAVAPQAAVPQRSAAPESWSDPDDSVPKVLPSAEKFFDPPDDTARPGARAEEVRAEGVARETRAVWIVHGMGQQIPFETLDSLTNGLLEALPGQTAKPRLRSVKIAGQTLQRVELDIAVAPVRGGAPGKLYELHLYESYWAPKTEGVAKLADVVSFLWDGGLRGLLNYKKKFSRAMFGGMAQFSVHFTTPLWLCVALLVVLALTVINGVVLAAAGAQTGLASLASFKLHWCQLTALASCMIAVAFSFGAVLFVTDMSKPQTLANFMRMPVVICCWLGAALTILQIAATALLMAVITHVDWTNGSQSCHSPGATTACTGVANLSPGWLEKVRTGVLQVFEKIPSPQLQGCATIVILLTILLIAAAMLTRAVLRSSEKRLEKNGILLILSVAAVVLHLAAFFGFLWIGIEQGTRGALPGYLCFLQSPLWVWPFLIIFSAKVREILIQFVGDVAIYVSSNKLDRFDEVRSKIKEAARSVASAVFTAYKQPEASVTETGEADRPPEFLYDKIAVVGHSLGSVIAYDTLNRLMLDDWLSGGVLQVAERTKTMVTFGSPLNKTAFLFTIQGSDSMHIRERLASTVQPLIISYPKFRKLTWINVYSWNDIISGKLKFYDLPGYQDPKPEDPEVPAAAIRNVKDPDAVVPLVAHTSYWKNKTVWNELLKEIAPGSVPVGELK